MTAVKRSARAEALRAAIVAMAERLTDSMLRFGMAKVGSAEETGFYSAALRQQRALERLTRALADMAGGRR